MFGLGDFLRLTLSVLIILPAVSIIRELGYLIAGKLLGGKGMNITIGSGPTFLKFWIFDVRKFYFMYCWSQYDSLKLNTRWAYMLIYSAPMLSNLAVALSINALLANDFLENKAFWNQFVFYAFYFLMFDAIPMYYPDGQPSNGRIVYDLICHKKWTDYKPDLPKSEEDQDDG